MSRILGQCENILLITEHSNKAKHCPEDRSGVIDSKLWWDNFEYLHWDRTNNKPLIEEPVYNKEHIARLRNIYLNLAGNKRLVIKNPRHIIRVRFLKEMFPSARFVFMVRHPWHTVQSMVIKGNDAFLLKLAKSNSIPADLLYQAVFSWSHAMSVYLNEKDEHWKAVQYENLIEQPERTIDELCNFLNIQHASARRKMLDLPSTKKRNYFYIHKMVNNSQYKHELYNLIEEGCNAFSYNPVTSKLKMDPLVYYGGEFKVKLNDFKKQYRRKKKKNLIKDVLR